MQLNLFSCPWKVWAWLICWGLTWLDFWEQTGWEAREQAEPPCEQWMWGLLTGWETQEKAKPPSEVVKLEQVRAPSDEGNV